MLSPFHNESSFFAITFPFISLITYRYLFSSGAFITSFALLPVISVGYILMFSAITEVASAFGLTIANKKAAGSLVAQNSEAPENAPPVAVYGLAPVAAISP